jgi:hypothetical protein
MQRKLGFAIISNHRLCDVGLHQQVVSLTHALKPRAEGPQFEFGTLFPKCAKRGLLQNLALHAVHSWRIPICSEAQIK